MKEINIETKQIFSIVSGILMFLYGCYVGIYVTALIGRGLGIRINTITVMMMTGIGVAILALKLKASLKMLSIMTCIFHGLFVDSLFNYLFITSNKNIAIISCVLVLIAYILNIVEILLAKIKKRDFSLSFLKWSFTIAVILILIVFINMFIIPSHNRFDLLSLIILLLPVSLVALLYWLNNNSAGGMVKQYRIK